MNKNEMTPAGAAAMPEDTIDLLEILFAFRRRWFAIVLAMLLFGAAFGAYGRFLVPDSYQADASLCITNSDTVISLSDLQVGTALTADYEAIIKSRVVLNKVIDNLDMGLTYSELYDMVTVSNPSDTHIIKIQVLSGDPDDSVTIANEVLYVSESEIYQVLGSSEPTILDVAEAAYVKNTKSSTASYILKGMLLGMVLVCALITISVITDTSLKGEEDIQRWCGLPVIGTIPDYKGKKKKTKVSWPVELPFHAAEAVYQLRTNIMYSGKNVKLISVTSAHENEGKSFVAFELAYSLAQVDKRTLLIDTDIRKSVLQARMGLEGVKLGLSEYLSGNAEIGQVIYDVDIPNLHVLFAGKLVPNASALLSAEWLGALVKEVRDSYDYIIFDTAPIGVVGDAAIVSSVTDGTLVVIENGMTTRRALNQVKADLKVVNANILGVVQNFVGGKQDSKYSSYYYGRYYGGYGKKYEKTYEAKKD